MLIRMQAIGLHSTPNPTIFPISYLFFFFLLSHFTSLYVITTLRSFSKTTISYPSSPFELSGQFTSPPCEFYENHHLHTFVCLSTFFVSHPSGTFDGLLPYPKLYVLYVLMYLLLFLRLCLWSYSKLLIGKLVERVAILHVARAWIALMVFYPRMAIGRSSLVLRLEESGNRMVRIGSSSDCGSLGQRELTASARMHLGRSIRGTSHTAHHLGTRSMRRLPLFGVLGESSRLGGCILLPPIDQIAT